MQTLKALGKIFTEHKFVNCKRQPSNLKKLLCSSKQRHSPTFKTKKCKKVVFCYYVREGKLFKVKNWHHPFILKSNFNCETRNFMYVIICSGCNKEYIGQT